MTISEYFEFLDPDTVATYPEHLRAAHDYLALAFRLDDLSNYPRTQVLVKEYLDRIEAYRLQKDNTEHNTLKDSPLNAPTRIEKKRSAILDNRLVDDIPPDVVVIKRYLSFHERKVSREEVRSLLNYIRRARLRGEISLNSEFYEEVKSIQQKLVAAHKKMSTATFFKLENHSVLILLTHPIRLRPSVQLLKRYISLGDKKTKDAKEKARELSQAIANALQGNRITTDDPFYEEVKDARKTLQTFLRSARKTLPIVEAELYGLDELPDDLKSADQLNGLNLCNEDGY